MTNEETLTDFMRANYSDENLAALLAHAEDGKLSFYSCCCFIGIPTADHALRAMSQTLEEGAFYQMHYSRAQRIHGAELAETAFRELGDPLLDDLEQDAQRRAKLIPLIRAELERRDRERSSSLSQFQVTVGV